MDFLILDKDVDMYGYDVPEVLAVDGCDLLMLIIVTVI